VALQSAASRADRLSQYATYFGDSARVNSELARYRALRAADVSAAARNWLGEDNRVSLCYVPRADATTPESA
jgi:predicted Zn-dependent peptidase